MELKQTNDLLERLPTESRSAITELIDIKTNDNMKEVLTAINSLRSDIDTKFAAIDTKFAAMDTKFAAMDSKFDAKFDGLSMRIKTLYWILGISIIPIFIYVIASIIK